MVFLIEELGKVLKRKDALLLMLLDVWPVLFSLVIRINPAVMTYSGRLSALGFLNQQLFVQSGILVPLIIMIYMSSVSLYQEVEEKQIYLYKDIPREEVLKGKYFSVYTVYFLFLLLYTGSCFLSYYGIFQKSEIATGTFSMNQEEILPLLYDSFQILAAFVFYIHIGFSLSLRFPAGESIFGTLFLYIFIKTTPTIEWAKRFTPAGFRELMNFGNNSLLYTLILSILVWLTYNIPMYFINKRYFKRMDFN